MKYIVKNCPNLSESYYADGHISQNECSLEILDTKCSDCTDCLTKQVIEKCRNYDKAMLKDLMLFKSVRVIVRDILQLFEIEECE